MPRGREMEYARARVLPNGNVDAHAGTERRLSLRIVQDRLKTFPKHWR